MSLSFFDHQRMELLDAVATGLIRRTPPAHQHAARQTLLGTFGIATPPGTEILRRELRDNVTASLAGVPDAGRDFASIVADLEATEAPDKAAARRARYARRAGKAGILLAFLAMPSFAAPCTVNVNAATPAELQFLARTGPVLAGRIVTARPLDAPRLDAVKGVGPSWLLVNGPHITYSGPTTCKDKIHAPKGGNS